MYLVYGLSDPRKEEIRYVGITKRTLKVRLYEHIYNRDKMNPKAEWLRSLAKDGIQPVIKTIEETKDELTALDREDFWTSYFRMLGYNLLNAARDNKFAPTRNSKNEDTKLIYDLIASLSFCNDMEDVLNTVIFSLAKIDKRPQSDNWDKLRSYLKGQGASGLYGELEISRKMP